MDAINRVVFSLFLQRRIKPHRSGALKRKKAEKAARKLDNPWGYHQNNGWADISPPWFLPFRISYHLNWVPSCYSLHGGKLNPERASVLRKWLAFAWFVSIHTETYLAVAQTQWYHFGVGEFTTHFRTYFSGGIGDVHWGTIWGFDPWPYNWYGILTQGLLTTALWVISPWLGRDAKLTWPPCRTADLLRGPSLAEKTLVPWTSKTPKEIIPMEPDVLGRSWFLDLPFESDQASGIAGSNMPNKAKKDLRGGRNTVPPHRT